jgi:hypothetical protein
MDIKLLNEIKALQVVIASDLLMIELRKLKPKVEKEFYPGRR